MDLNDFFETIVDDPRIGLAHIALYIVIKSELELLPGIDLLELDRQRIMRKAKLNARSTYDKTMRDLHDFGYVLYERGRGNRKGTVRLKRL